MADLHEVIVDDHREVVRGKPVGLEQHLVVDVGVVEAHPAADDVVPLGHALGHAEPHHPAGMPAGALLRHLVLPGETAPVVSGGLRPLPLRVAHGGEARRGACAPVRVAVRDQLVGDARRYVSMRNDWMYGSCGPPTSGPSSQSSPSQLSVSMMSASVPGM